MPITSKYCTIVSQIAPFALLLGTIAPRCATAQVADTTLGTELLANRTLHGSLPDTFLLTLHKGGQYRIGVWPATTTVRVSVAGHPDRTVFSPRVREGDGDHVTVIELYPQDDGPHRFIVSPPDRATAARLWLWEDSTAERHSAVKEAKRWHVGLAAEAGGFNGYKITDSEPARSTPHFDGSILIASSSRWSFALGFGNDSRPGAPESVNWGFVEPRFRLGEATLAGRAVEINLAIRWSQGNATSIQLDPDLSTIGVLAQWHLDHRRGTRGWLLGARAMIGQIRNLGLRSQAVSYFGVSLGWIP